ncbi:MAG: superinfection immunity protein [Alphaproteobacteria bacterium]|nr:superinfection immunity protein [Alphaproteobacteria bacterium]
MHYQFAELALVVASGTLYALPSFVALRDHTITADHVEALIVNALLGWTVIGWGFAMFLALREPQSARRKT